MDGYMENGPRGTKTEAQKIGDGLYLVLQKKYSGYELSMGNIALGDPQVVKIDIEVLPSDPNHKTALDALQKDVLDILQDYGFDHDRFSIIFETNGSKHIIKIQEVTV
jgi:hypothetical protein